MKSIFSVVIAVMVSLTVSGGAQEPKEPPHGDATDHFQELQGSEVG